MPLRVFLICLMLLVPAALADTPFEIPRSSVVNLEDKATSRTYPLFIKLPASYNESFSKKYPVIVLTDAWYTFQIVSGATRFPMNFKKMEEAIIVAISYSEGSKGQESRIRDFTPVKAVNWKYPTGGAGEHIEFIQSTVIPYIDTHYRTDKSRRTFVGNSLGGLFGAYILFTKPEMFSSYILGSPSVWYNDQSILTLKVKPVSSTTKVYVSVGALEESKTHPMVSDANVLASKIQKESGKNISIKFSVIEGARHSTAFPTTVIQGLDWIYGLDQK